MSPLQTKPIADKAEPKSWKEWKNPSLIGQRSESEITKPKAKGDLKKKSRSLKSKYSTFNFAWNVDEADG